VAESNRDLITGVVVETLGAITTSAGYQTDVRYVSEDFVSYDQIDLKRLPALFPLDGNETHEQIALTDSAVWDMQAELEMIITAVVYDRRNQTRRQRTRLLRDIGKAMATILDDGTLAAFIRSVTATSVKTDNGTIPNYSVFDFAFAITYDYDSDIGG
jgi:hypothetical protein